MSLYVGRRQLQNSGHILRYPDNTRNPAEYDRYHRQRDRMYAENNRHFGRDNWSWENVNEEDLVDTSIGL